MKKLLFFAVLCLLVLPAFAQSLKQETDWLEKKMNTLVVNDEKEGAKVNGKESKPQFKFAGCQMEMIIAAKDKDFSFAMNLGWLLKDVKKVSYKKEKKGNYELVLDVPADRIKMDMGFGKENNIGGSFKLDDKDKSNYTNFSLDTKDERLAQELVEHFETASKTCRK